MRLPFPFQGGIITLFLVGWLFSELGFLFSSLRVEKPDSTVLAYASWVDKSQFYSKSQNTLSKVCARIKELHKNISYKLFLKVLAFRVSVRVEKHD